MKPFILLFIFCTSSFFAFGQEYRSYWNDANKAFQNGDYDKAIKDYRSYIVLGGTNNATFINKAEECKKLLGYADVLFAAGNYSEATTKYQELLKLNPSDSYAKKRIADCNRLKSTPKEEKQPTSQATASQSNNLQQTPKEEQQPLKLSGHNLLPRPHLTFADNSIYANNKKLTKNEVWILFENTDALQLYNKGLAKNRIGTVLLISGALVSGGGGFIFAKHPFDKKSFYRGGDGNTYYRYQNETLNDALGIGIMAAGAGMIIAGIVLKLNSPNVIKDAVNMYNGGRNRSSIEWKLDFSGNGVRLAVNF